MANCLPLVTSLNAHLVPGDPGYPHVLADAMGERAKPLQVRGALPVTGWSVAVVGSRRATSEGMALAEQLAHRLASQGVTVVSGGALGIDAAAHRGALAAGGRTVAVLGTGIDVVYPERHRALFEQIVAGGGALVSTFDDGALPLPGHFVARNAFIAGLSHAVVVVEAAARSGSLSTARFAAKQGKRVGAIAGSPGANQLLAGGAFHVRSADDVLAALAGGPAPSGPSAPPSLDEEPAKVLAAMPQDDVIDEEALALALGLTPRAVVRALSALQLMGLVTVAPGRRYRRTASPSAFPARGSRGQYPN